MNPRGELWANKCSMLNTSCELCRCQCSVLHIGRMVLLQNWIGGSKKQ